MHVTLCICVCNLLPSRACHCQQSKAMRSTAHAAAGPKKLKQEAPSLDSCGMRRMLLPLALLLAVALYSSTAQAPPPTPSDALRDSFALQLEDTGAALSALLCATALAALPGQCQDNTAQLWANATAANATASPLALLQSLVAPVDAAITSALSSIAAISDLIGSSGTAVDTVPPGAKPWSVGSTTEPTYLGEIVSLTPAVHVPSYAAADAVAQDINADISMLGSVAPKMKQLYTAAPQPLMVASMTGATVYMPAPWQAADARAQPWFQGTVLPPRNIIIVADMWTSDRTSGVVRVAQVNPVA